MNTNLLDVLIRNFNKFKNYFFKDVSLFIRITTFFTLAMLFILFAFSMTLYGKFSNYMVEEIILDDSNINSLLTAQINNLMKYSEELSKQIIGHQIIQERLNTSYTDTNENIFNDINKNKAINETLYRYANNSMINFIVVSSMDGKQYSSSAQHVTYNINSDQLMTRLSKSKGEIIWYISNMDLFNVNNADIYIYLIRKINSLDNSDKTIGYLFIRINSNYFINDVINKRIPKGDDYYEVLDENRMVICNTLKESSIGKKCDNNIVDLIKTGNKNWFYLNDNVKYIVTFKRITDNGWTIVHYIPNKYISDKIFNLRYLIVILGFISLIIAFGLSLVLSKTITKPIKTLCKAMNQYGKKGVLDKLLLKTRNDEMGILQNEFEKMVERVIQLMDNTKNDQKNKLIMEFQIKEYQINPHFLYNSLDSINWMANQAGQDEIGKMATYLARFFRISLSKGNEFYSIREEIELIKYYMLICNIRYGGILNFELKLDEEILDLKTIKLILQPIVENSVKHGIDKIQGNGLICIEGYIQDANVILIVKDNGIGMDEEIADDLNWRFNQSDINNYVDAGFGMANVNQRIKLYFGKEYGLNVISSIGKGTYVKINMPVIKTR